MVVPPTPAADPRSPLTRERVLEATLRLADRDGIETLSMSRLVDAMIDPSSARSSDPPATTT